MLTIQIITYNNEDTIEKCINSILPLNPTIDIIDTGSVDKTIEICKNFNLKVNEFKFISDYSDLRNERLKSYTTKWKMTLEPDEYLFKNNIEKLFLKDSSYKFKIIQNNTIMNETRLWCNKNIKFKNLIFEYIEDLNAINCESIIVSKGIKKINNIKEILNIWKNKEPFNVEPLYYEAFNELKNKNYKKFYELANHYLFVSKKETNSSLMMRYYVAMIELFYFKNVNSSNNNIMKCISKKPLMAEFWCLLGDIFYYLKDKIRAISFYENAILLGSKRKNDDLPLDISKYKEYPEKMINKLNSINI
jgi:hypothetical protein